MTLIGKFPKEDIFTPKPFGPCFDWEGDSEIKILDGELTGQKFFLEKELTDNFAQIILYSQGKRIGHCSAEYEKNSLITIWDVFVDDKYLKKGLASLMIKILTRELLFRQTTTRIKFRVITLFKPDEQEIRLRNVGIGNIVYKLGLTCEYDLEALIMQHNVVSIDVVPPIDSTPPAYKITLNIYPYTLITFIIDSVTEKPILDFDIYIKFRSQYEVIINWAQNQQLVIGNANYLLKDNGISEFINRLANSKAEAELFYNRIQPLK